MDGHDVPVHQALPTRWEVNSGGIEFRLWTRPVIERGHVTPITLTWRHHDGAMGQRSCGGMLEATEYASRAVTMADVGVVLRNWGCPDSR